eukprot:CAMPEP_0183418078 /NCGR_PEP_ID=MMETSP0370-20130417/24863_1 /TAXON_ID=268820 /ORGANISM="Peridinium aciculiferum, Strain PAER-2" /LENGTH=212 /DNA_ID=CAMNT_0025601735 /DNA_START=449 /DNA_END=1088 /DNA_ORIENTATION=-
MALEAHLRGFNLSFMSPVDAVLGPSDGGDRKLVLAAPWILMNVHSTMIGHLCWTSHVASARGTRVPLRPFNLTFAFQFVAHKNVTRVKLDALQRHGPHHDVVHVWVYEHFCPRRIRQLNMVSGSLQLGAASLQLGAREQHFIEDAGSRVYLSSTACEQQLSMTASLTLALDKGGFFCHIRIDRHTNKIRNAGHQLVCQILGMRFFRKIVVHA